MKLEEIGSSEYGHLKFIVVVINKDVYICNSLQSTVEMQKYLLLKCSRCDKSATIGKCKFGTWKQLLAHIIGRHNKPGVYTVVAAALVFL